MTTPMFVRLHIRNAPFSRISFLQPRFPLRSPYPKLIRTSARVAPLLAVGACITAFSKPTIYCDPARQSEAEITREDLPPPPSSAVSFYQLTFGTVAGICAGVFVKKGVKAMAWLLGGVFVLLQYLGSKSLVRVDWAGVETGFEHLFYTQDASGYRRPPTIASVWRRLVDFLTADFQPRASFLAGLALGVRVG